MKVPPRYLLLLGCAALALRGAEAPQAGDYEKVGFDRLAAFTYTAPETEANADPKQIPEKIQALDQRRVAVTGFMLPVKLDKGLVVEFLLVKDPMLCCYGVMPKVNEWIVVRMVTGGVKPLMDVPITFQGRLRVGAMFENGYLTGIYLLEGERQAQTKG